VRARDGILALVRATGVSSRLWICLLLAAATLAVYAPVARFEFLNYDDGEYVAENPFVQHGVTPASVQWAFTTGRSANWHPLTWISHTLDWSLYGGSAGGHHVTSVLLHVANAILLFLFLDRATAARGRSALVAALFALHPLHVESVAWIAERKDVLSTLFWMLTLLAYLAWVRAPGAGRYALVAASLAAGLMAKPMLVSLPLVLLFLDSWPLGRPPRVREKLPLFALAAASCAVTFLVQQTGGAVKSTTMYPLTARVGNALVSYVAYVLQMLWPAKLAIFYPHPGEALPWWKPAASALVLALVTVAVVRARKTRPYLLAGWLWYVVTLVPVIGIVQVGLQSRADRYTYVPLVGLFWIVAWGGWDLAKALLPREHARALAIGAGAIVLVLAVISAVQVRTWRNSLTVFQHAVEAAGESDVAHIHIGLAVEKAGQRAEAIEHYRAAARLNPDTAAFYLLGNALADDGDVQGALAAYKEAVRSEPWFEPSRYALGSLLLEQGKVDEAIEQFQGALDVNPQYAEAEFQWGMALTSRRQWAEAANHFEAAIRIEPRFANAHYNLALTRYLTGDYAAARREVEIARGLGYVPEQRFLDMLREKGTR
jgi:tetratricopeptide (TPR) repeat protein